MPHSLSTGEQDALIVVHAEAKRCSVESTERNMEWQHEINAVTFWVLSVPK